MPSPKIRAARRILEGTGLYYIGYKTHEHRKTNKQPKKAGHKKLVSNTSHKKRSKH